MITILCSGSRGDFQPYIALAQELQKLGKNVRIVSGKNFEELITGYGIGFYELSVDYQSIDIDPQMIKEAQSSDNPIKMLLTFNKDEKDNFVKLIVEASKICGKRGIICGMGEISELPDNIFAINGVPHTWLFPRCSAVCHHGGAGTSAAGFASGVPSVIIPFSNDQFAWAYRAYDLGVGSKPIPRKKLTANNLSDAIHYSLKSDVIKKAAFLGEHIRNEDGAKKAASEIISFLSKQIRVSA